MVWRGEENTVEMPTMGWGLFGDEWNCEFYRFLFFYFLFFFLYCSCFILFLFYVVLFLYCSFFFYFSNIFYTNLIK